MHVTYPGEDYFVFTSFVLASSPFEKQIFQRSSRREDLFEYSSSVCSRDLNNARGLIGSYCAIEFAVLRKSGLGFSSCTLYRYQSAVGDTINPDESMLGHLHTVVCWFDFHFTAAESQKHTFLKPES